MSARGGGASISGPVPRRRSPAAPRPPPRSGRRRPASGDRLEPGAWRRDDPAERRALVATGGPHGLVGEGRDQRQTDDPGGDEHRPPRRADGDVHHDRHERHDQQEAGAAARVATVEGADAGRLERLAVLVRGSSCARRRGRRTPAAPPAPGRAPTCRRGGGRSGRPLDEVEREPPSTPAALAAMPGPTPKTPTASTAATTVETATPSAEQPPPALGFTGPGGPGHRPGAEAHRLTEGEDPAARGTRRARSRPAGRSWLTVTMVPSGWRTARPPGASAHHHAPR